MKKIHFPQKAIRNLCIFAVLFTLSGALQGCDFAKSQLKPDRDSEAEMQDFRDVLSSRVPDVGEDGSSNRAGGTIPSLQSYISEATPGMKPMPLVSISVNQSIPLKDVLFELAQQADYDLELDPRIRGSIIYTVRNKPFDMVVERISEIAGLRHQFEDGILRVELDMPYNKVYKIDYLNIIRTNAGSIRNSISVVTGDGADTGSQYEAVIASEADFWGELNTSIAQLLSTSEPNRMMTEFDPIITAVQQNPDIAPVAPQFDGQGNVIVQPPEVSLEVQSLPTAGDPDFEAEERLDATDEQNPFRPTFSISQQAGVINVYASHKTHKAVQDYLRILRRSVTSQVLIEAKILEVTLNDEFATGINWRSMGLLSGELQTSFLNNSFGILNTLSPDVTPVIQGTNLVTQNSSLALGYLGNDVQAVVEAISAFGTVKALASPRLTVLNNQSAVLNVATNVVFFEIDIEQTTDEGVTDTNVDSQIRNVPEGVIVNVQPSIDLDSRSISMSLRPTITRITQRVPDPAVQFLNVAGVESLIPEVNVQEIDSVIKMRSGQPIVMGGLLQDRSTVVSEGVPGLMEIPMVGGLFRSNNNLIRKTELVILLKATILDGDDGGISNSDKDLYRRFSEDRRPFKL
jgi:MSHA biogenesis protein MshL